MEGEGASRRSRTQSRTGRGAAGAWHGRWLACCCVLGMLTTAGAVSAATHAAEAAAWEAAGQMLFPEATGAFERLMRAEGEGASRSVRLGRSAMFLLQQPRTRGNLERARAGLGRLIAEDSHDEIGLFARFLLARLDQWYAPERNLAAAVAGYEALFAERPDHELGQLAAFKVVMLRLHQPMAVEAKREVFAEMEALGAIIREPAIRRNYHLVMGISYGRMVDDWESAWRHYEACIELEIVKWNTRGRVLIRAGEIARTLGHTDTALRYYRRFIEEYPRDARRYEISRLVSDLEAADGP
jgi:tetratricopeptide (TPR) repeat protein